MREKQGSSDMISTAKMPASDLVRRRQVNCTVSPRSVIRASPAPTVGSLLDRELLTAIGTGGMFFAWHNSSPFWIINEIGGLNHKETVKTFSIVGLIMSIAGLIITLVLATVLPMA